MVDTGKARQACGIGPMYGKSGPVPHDTACLSLPRRDGVITQLAARMGRMAPSRRDTCTVPIQRVRDTFTLFSDELESPCFVWEPRPCRSPNAVRN
jgi:hypothetical protein